MNVSDLRIKTKLMLGFSALAVVVVLVSSLALHALSKADNRFADYLDGIGQREHLIVLVREATNRRAIAARNLVLVTSPADREVEKAAVLKAHEDVSQALKALQASMSQYEVTDDERRQMTELNEIEASYGQVALDIVNLALQGNRTEAINKMNNECRPLLARLLNAVGHLLAYDDARAVDAGKQAHEDYKRDRLWMVVACLVALCVAMAMGWLLSQMITRPLQRAVQLAEAVASGDLRSHIEVNSQDETGQLLSALKRMNDSLVDMVQRVRQSADGIATASSQIASGSQDLSGRTEHQASGLQQTAASMKEMTFIVQQNAESSQQASQLASSAAEVAERGGSVVERVVTTMDDISSSSRKIADIISVIDGIAFQTNILALNAAVEAARAGEQGRGFAVVASEVRSLAQRSANAAKEIKTLIHDSTEKVQAGSQLVGEAGGTMRDIVNQVRNVTDLVAAINTSTAEQSTGIAQVNQAVATLDDGTQQNAALVEQSAAAAESLKQQAAGLLGLIAAFKTADMH